MSDYRAMRDLRKSLATSALLVQCEGIAASGYLPGRQEEQLRRLIAEVRIAFGPDVPERELPPENVIPISRNLDLAAQRILDAVDAEMRK